MSWPASNEPRGVLATHVVLAGLTIAALAPFLGKAFHMDDPLFIWTAKHLRLAPFDFYGFDVNWEGTLARMSSVTQRRWSHGRQARSSRSTETVTAAGGRHGADRTGSVGPYTPTIGTSDVAAICSGPLSPPT